MPTITEHLVAAADRGFNVEYLETLTQNLRDLTRHVGRAEYREAELLAEQMGFRCGSIMHQCARFAEYDRVRTAERARAEHAVHESGR